MRVLVLGVGAVGEAYCFLGVERDPGAKWLEKVVLADYTLDRPRMVQEKLHDARFVIEQVNAADQEQVKAVCKKHTVDLLINCCPQSLNYSIFDAALEAGVNYLDLAATLSEKHPTDPYHKVGSLLGEHQFNSSKKWREANRLAIIAMGIDPGVTDIFARQAEQNLFDELEEIRVRDGSNMYVEGYDFAPTFSVWSVIEETLNPPYFWEKDKGWYTKEPFADPEIFEFPEGIGPQEVVTIEHEEVILIPRFINKGLKKVTYKISLGREFIEVLRTIRKLGLDNPEKINVKGVMVSPRDVVEACVPNPSELGHLMHGKMSVGIWVKGKKDGKQKEIYIYQCSDNQDCMKRYNCQAVAVQTALGPIIASELLARGIWSGSGVRAPEEFAPEPFLELMGEYGHPYRIIDMPLPE